MLCENNADVNRTDYRNQTPLMQLCESGGSDVAINHLLKHGADVNALVCFTISWLLHAHRIWKEDRQSFTVQPTIMFKPLDCCLMLAQIVV
jgi:hypothetical protein